MMIYLDPRTQLTNGSSMTLKRSTCIARKYAPSNEYGLITTYDKCGTTKRETSTHIIYENEVNWKFGASSGIARSSGKKIQFSCSFERHQDTATVHLDAASSYVTASEGDRICYL